MKYFKHLFWYRRPAAAKVVHWGTFKIPKEALEAPMKESFHNKAMRMLAQLPGDMCRDIEERRTAVQLEAQVEQWEKDSALRAEEYRRRVMGEFKAPEPPKDLWTFGDKPQTFPYLTEIDVLRAARRAFPAKEIEIQKNGKAWYTLPAGATHALINKDGTFFDWSASEDSAYDRVKRLGPDYTVIALRERRYRAVRHNGEVGFFDSKPNAARYVSEGGGVVEDTETGVFTSYARR